MSKKNQDISCLLNKSYDDLRESQQSINRWVVSFSGGLDSLVLLHSIVEWRSHQSTDKKLPTLHALHVNHNLSPQAKAWAEFCRQICLLYSVSIDVVSVNVDMHSGKGVEAAARESRHKTYRNKLFEDDLLLQGHHANDQLETFLLRAIRSAGLKGLLSIPEKRDFYVYDQLQNKKKKYANIVRPLLGFSKNDLKKYSEKFDLTWIEDDSNQDISFDRNYLRKKIIPVLENRWPDVTGNVKTSIKWLNESFELSEDLARLDLALVNKESSAWQSQSICLTKFSELSNSRKKNLLRHWVETYYSYLLTSSQLMILISDHFTQLKLIDYEKNCLMLEVSGNRLHCFYLSNDVSDIESNEYPLMLREEIAIEGCGAIVVDLEGDLIKQLTCSNQVLKVRFRRGGERAHPYSRTHSQQLKKLFQEYKVPSWWRSRVPLIYLNETLIAVGDLWVEKGVSNPEDVKCIWKKSAF